MNHRIAISGDVVFPHHTCVVTVLQFEKQPHGVLGTQVPVNLFAETQRVQPSRVISVAGDNSMNNPIIRNGGRGTGKVVNAIGRLTPGAQSVGEGICYSEWRTKGGASRYQTTPFNRYAQGKS